MTPKQILQETLIPPLASSNRCGSRWWYPLAGQLLSGLASKQRNTMTSAKFALGVLLLLISIAASSKPPDIRGKFTGNFKSKHSDVRPHTITMEVNPDSSGRLVGKAKFSSDCLKNFKDVDLQVTVDDSNNVSFAGGNPDGNVTLLGTVDETGTILNFSEYIINGSLGGGCELDTGAGTAQKQ